VKSQVNFKVILTAAYNSKNKILKKERDWKRGMKRNILEH
jgi:hypothetical protein